MATLCLLNEKGATIQQWDIHDKPVTIGRGTRADVQIEDEGLSRRHFTIAREGADYLLKDLNSRNGTWVGGAREISTLLRHQDRIVAGHTQFRFHQPAPLKSSRALTGPHDTVILGRSTEADGALDEALAIV